MSEVNFKGNDLTIEELVEIRSRNVLRKGITDEIKAVLDPHVGEVLTPELKNQLVDTICDLTLIKNLQLAFNLLILQGAKLEQGVKINCPDPEVEMRKLLDIFGDTLINGEIPI